MKFEELTKTLEEYNKNKHNYSLAEISKIANKILTEIDYYSGRGATPIIKIAKEFDFKIYKEDLKNNKSSNICVNGETKERYGHDKIIVVNKSDDLFHQRLAVTYELAHYLFDFIGNPDYTDENKQFTDAYHNMYGTIQEKRTNAFAIEILMPRNLFMKQYHIAKHDNSNRMFILMYLSRFFEIPIDSIETKLNSI